MEQRAKNLKPWCDIDDSTNHVCEVERRHPKLHVQTKSQELKIAANLFSEEKEGEKKLRMILCRITKECFFRLSATEVSSMQ